MEGRNVSKPFRIISGKFGVQKHLKQKQSTETFKIKWPEFRAKRPGNANLRRSNSEPLLGKPNLHQTNHRLLTRDAATNRCLGGGNLQTDTSNSSQMVTWRNSLGCSSKCGRRRMPRAMRKSTSASNFEPFPANLARANIQTSGQHDTEIAKAMTRISGNDRVLQISPAELELALATNWHLGSDNLQNDTSNTFQAVTLRFPPQAQLGNFKKENAPHEEAQQRQQTIPNHFRRCWLTRTY